MKIVVASFLWAWCVCVAGDDCVDLCEFHPACVEEGSYCKNKSVCHGLYWENAAIIFRHKGVGDEVGKAAVTCADAKKLVKMTRTGDTKSRSLRATAPNIYGNVLEKPQETHDTWENQITRDDSYQSDAQRILKDVAVQKLYEALFTGPNGEQIDYAESRSLYG